MNEFFLNYYKNISTLQIIIEAIVFVFGIWSVWLAKKENIGAFPTGLIATCFTVYLLYNANYFGDMVVNIYYSIMSIYGWYSWNAKNEQMLHITKINKTDFKIAGFLFIVTILFIVLLYHVLKYSIQTENYFDIFTSGIFFFGYVVNGQKKNRALVALDFR